MSSVTSQIAQIGRRINYFRTLAADVSGYTMAVAADNNSWAAPVAATLYANNTILQDMGEIAKYNGQILRKVRAISAPGTPAGGVATAYFIVMPGGEYPTQGMSSTTVTTGSVSVLPISAVARLG